jgi:transcription elongation factor GreA-like protein
MKKFLRNVVEILLDDQGKLSIGRVLLLSVFIMAMIKWSTGQSIDDSALTVLLSLLGYVLSGKILESVSEKVGSIKEIKENVKELMER